jgi:hypothetical protein
MKIGRDGQVNGKDGGQSRLEGRCFRLPRAREDAVARAGLAFIQVASRLE